MKDTSIVSQEKKNKSKKPYSLRGARVTHSPQSSYQESIHDLTELEFFPATAKIDVHSQDPEAQKLQPMPSETSVKGCVVLEIQVFSNPRQTYSESL